MSKQVLVCGVVCNKVLRVIIKYNPCTILVKSCREVKLDCEQTGKVNGVYLGVSVEQ